MARKIAVLIFLVFISLGFSSDTLARQKSLEFRALQIFDLSQDITHFQMEEVLLLTKNREFIEARVSQYEFGKNWNKNIPTPDIGAGQMMAGVMVDSVAIIPIIGITEVLTKITKIRIEADRALVAEYLDLRKQGKSEKQAWQAFLDERQWFIDKGISPRIAGRRLAGSRFSGINIDKIMENPDGEYAKAVRIYFAFVWEANEISEQRGHWNDTRSQILSEAQRLIDFPIERTPSVFERAGDWLANTGDIVLSFAKEYNPFRAGIATLTPTSSTPTVLIPVGPAPSISAPAGSAPSISVLIESTEDEPTQLVEPKSTEKLQKIVDEKFTERELLGDGLKIEIEKKKTEAELEKKAELIKKEQLIEIKKTLDDIAKEIDVLSRRVDEFVAQRLVKEKQKLQEKEEVEEEGGENEKSDDNGDEKEEASEKEKEDDEGKVAGAKISDPCLDGGKIDINRAGAEYLVFLDGIGKDKAKNIVDYRRLSPFSLLDGLVNVKGIDPVTLQKIKDQRCAYVEKSPDIIPTPYSFSPSSSSSSSTKDSTVAKEKGAKMEIDKQEFFFSLEIGGNQSDYQHLTIQNSGDSVLSWIIEGNEEWVSFSPTSGEIIPSSVPIIVEIKIDSDGLDVGEYTATTIISGNYDNYSQEIQISLSILPAPILDRTLTPEEVIDSLTAPDSGVPLTPEEEARRKKMIDDLTAPEPEIPLTSEEVEKEEVEEKEEMIDDLVVTGN